MKPTEPKHLFPSSRAALLLPLFLLAALACSDESTDPSAALEGPSGLVLLPVSSPTDLTPDGSTALLEERFDISKLANLYFYDVATGTLNYQTNAGTFQSFATGVSANLRISANYSEPTIAAIWSQPGDWATMPPYFSAGCEPIFLGGAWDISAGRPHHGLASTGTGAARSAMRCSEAGGTIDGHSARAASARSYPDSPNPPSNRASVVSGDGLVGLPAGRRPKIVDRLPAAVAGRTASGSFLTSGVSSRHTG